MDLINENEFKIQIDGQGKTLLLAIAKWGNFLSIVGFIFIGLLVILALFSGSIFGSALSTLNPAMAIGTGMITTMYLFLAALYFFPTLFHFQYIQKLKKSLAQNNTELFNEALTKLKSVYAFIGVLTIIILSIYALIFLFGIIGAAAM